MLLKSCITYNYTTLYWLLHHTLIFTIHCSTRIAFLQITSSLLRIKTIKLMTCEAASFENVLH